MSVDEARPPLLDQPHHDGSDLHIVERPDELGGDAVVRSACRARRAPTACCCATSATASRAVEATIDEETDTDLWRAEFPLANPVTRYRWLLSGGTPATRGSTPRHLRARGGGLRRLRDQAGRGGPTGTSSSVAYQIFPDASPPRLATDVPDWAVPRGWDELPTGRGRPTPFELYGGDLRGVEQHLDHIESLGANLIDLTPFFPASSTHRYDATSFAARRPAARRRPGPRVARASGPRARHPAARRHHAQPTGHEHEWFQAARADPSAPERAFYYFDDAIPGGYESWLGHRTLPKLNWQSAELHERFAEVLRRYLELGLDGWRIDVANMVGRYRELDLEPRRVEVDARAGRRRAADRRARARLPARPAVRGWHGVMNYSGFLRPLWTWLLRDDPEPEQQRQFWGIGVGVPQLDGAASVAALQRFRAGVPWESVLHSWNLLDSHDTHASARSPARPTATSSVSACR